MSQNKYESIFDNLTDEEFEDILKEYGFKYCKVDKGKGGLRVNNEEKNKIYHQCECGNTNIDIFSVREVLHHAQGMDIPAVEINYICPDCGSMMTESSYLYKRKEK